MPDYGGTSVKHFYLLVTLLISACSSPIDRATCDEDKARRVVVTDDEDQFPAYEGQALTIRNCANGFCHTDGANGFDRYGVPKGLDFDVSLAFESENNDRLRLNQLTTHRNRHAIFSTVVKETMPPGEAGEAVVDLSPIYKNLPRLGTDEGREILRNWLSCGSPVVERTNARPAGSEPVGAIIPLGQQTLSCNEGETQCGNTCADLMSSNLNCGTCGVTCAQGQQCEGGSCAGCIDGLSECGGTCLNVQTDPDNCGDCGNACTDTQVCSSGSCTSECSGSQTNCDGACVDVQQDIFNCGACGVECAEGCTDGVCACGDTQTDIMNCGECGKICDAGRICTGGDCVCETGDACDGVCVDLRSDGSNCGECGMVCGDSEVCKDGMCEQCGGDVQFEADLLPVLVDTCAGSMCHSGRRPSAMLSLEAAVAYDNLVNQPASCGGNSLVTAGDIEASYLINKITGSGMCKGRRMPLKESALSNEVIAQFQEWVCAGAPNN